MRHEIVTRITTTSLKASDRKDFRIFVLFFPQMKPEKKAIAISDVAKGILEILKKYNKVTLSQLKKETNLSNKKWDKHLKELTKKGIVSVKKPLESELEVWLEK